MIYSFILIISLLLFTFNVIQVLLCKHDDNTIFLILCIIVFNLTLILFWNFFHNLSIFKEEPEITTIQKNDTRIQNNRNLFNSS